MKTKLNKILSVALLLVIMFVTAFALIEKTRANSNDYVDREYMVKGGGASTPNAVATTTAGVTFKAAGATTTFPVAAKFADTLSFDIRFTASTSAGTLVGNFETSNDTSCDTDPNRCNWSITPVLTSGITYASTTATFNFRPDGALNATSSLNVAITPTSKYYRLNTSCTGSACAFHISVTRKTQKDGFSGN